MAGEASPIDGGSVVSPDATPAAAAPLAVSTETPAVAPESASEAAAASPVPVAAEPAGDPSAQEAPASVIDAAIEPAAEAPAVAETAPEPPPAPVYADFKLPDGFTVEAPQLETFTGVLGKYGLTQEAGQELMDLHAQTLQTAVDAMAQRQQDVFDGMRKDWRNDFFKSAGNRADTMANDAKWAIQQLVPDAKERAELHGVLRASGVGDNKAIINLLARAASKMRERAAPAPPIPSRAPEGSKADQRYNRTRT